MSFSPCVLLVCPTLNPGPSFRDWIKALRTQQYFPDKVSIIDSSSDDDTVSMALTEGFEVATISRNEFNHGRTRKTAIDKNQGYDLVIFLTQDAILSTSESLKNIIEVFKDENIAAVCGRQIPRPGAGAIESHARLFNYPERSFSRTFDDVNQYGLKTAFISNSFAGYRVEAFEKAGGFPEDAIFGEDMYVAAKILKTGYKIAYVAEACVYHSHSYSLMQEFKRYFDMGVFHAREPWLRQELGEAEGEGIKFVISEIRYLSKNAFRLIPEGLMRTILRYTGFRMGLAESYIPLRVKRRMSMNPGYFIK